MKGYTEFNINNYVYVKLTDHGYEVYNKYYKKIPKEYNISIPEIEKDENGFSKWQLWQLMLIFGSSCGNGFTNPFETTIYFEEEDTKFSDLYEVVKCKCPECGKIKKLSLNKGEDFRHTYCIDCGEAVIWEKI